MMVCLRFWLELILRGDFTRVKLSRGSSGFLKYSFCISIEMILWCLNFEMLLLLYPWPGVGCARPERLVAPLLASFCISEAPSVTNTAISSTLCPPSDTLLSSIIFQGYYEEVSNWLRIWASRSGCRECDSCPARSTCAVARTGLGLSGGDVSRLGCWKLCRRSSLGCDIRKLGTFDQ